MPRFLLTPFGSAGDVNPFIWMGRLLRARGHEATLITAPLFREVAERAGLEFVGVGEEDDLLGVLADPDLWKPLRGTARVFDMAVKALRPFYEAISERLEGKGTVLVAPFHVFAARAAREKFQVPLVTVHLQPAAMISLCDETLFIPGADWMTRVPTWLKKLAFKLPNPADRHVGKPLRAFCGEIGIPAPRRVIPDWVHSPDANLLLFPEWFAPRPADWPANAVAAGFPLEDLSGQFQLPAELEAFLGDGEPPVLLSPGTGNLQAREFFAVGLAACQRLGRRALLGTRFPEQLPHPLPSCARTFDYLPFSEVLPRVCAMVHHGGIGTLSQGLAAGVPQLIMPMAHDQPDNSRRARKFGVAEELVIHRFTVENVTAALRRLAESEAVAAACRRAAERMRRDQAEERAMSVLEGAARSQGSQ